MRGGESWKDGRRRADLRKRDGMDKTGREEEIREGIQIRNDRMGMV